DGMINDDIKQSTAYKTFLDYATRKVAPKKARKFKKHASPKLKTIPASPKEPTQKGNGSSEGADFKSEVPDEQTGKTNDTSSGTGVKPRVLDTSKADSSDSDNKS
ncbi:hypothetical protein Tco_0287889, partial [Tanacetum coccineum]